MCERELKGSMWIEWERKGVLSELVPKLVRVVQELLVIDERLLWGQEVDLPVANLIKHFMIVIYDSMVVLTTNLPI